MTEKTFVNQGLQVHTADQIVLLTIQKQPC